ncbi:MAG: hypothetical protein HY873_09645, partial [Chloroflexi bacterium]|nr:hypothetical protein [Chloroflexota bacterium]
MVRSKSQARARDYRRFVQSKRAPYRGLGAETLDSELYLFRGGAAYVSFSIGGLLPNATVQVLVLHLVDESENRDAFVAQLDGALSEIGLCEGPLGKIEPDDDDTSWMENLPNMTVPSHTQVEVSAAMLLSSEGVRSDLRTLARAAKRDSPVIEHEEELRVSGLIEDLHWAKCQDGKEFLADSKAAIESSTSRCPHCRKQGREHEIAIALVPTELGRNLLNKSRWMTIQATVMLMAAGVAMRSIRVPAVGQAPDEVDLAFLFDGRRSLCELKDDEVTAGDVANLVARSDVMGQGEVLVITTKSVTSDARKVLDRAFRPTFSLRTQTYECLEGASCISTDLTFHLAFERLGRFAEAAYLFGPGESLGLYQLLLTH